MSFYTWGGYDLAADDDTEEHVSVECYESLAYELQRVCSFLATLGCTDIGIEHIINGTMEQRMAVWYRMTYNYD